MLINTYYMECTIDRHFIFLNLMLETSFTLQMMKIMLREAKELPEVTVIKWQTVLFESPYY